MYSEKQKSGTAPTQPMLKLARDLQELSALNEVGRELRVECEVLADKLRDPAYDPIKCNLARELTTVCEKTTSFVWRVSRYLRTPATHLLVVISAEDRKTKPYAIPVQCIVYNSLKDVEIRCIANKVVQEMHKRGMNVAGKYLYIYMHEYVWLH